MPFPKSATPIQFSWEGAVPYDVDFYEVISSRNIFTYWSRACRALRYGSGLFAVRSNFTVVGIMSSPRLLYEVLVAWRNLPEKPHPRIESELLKLPVGVCRQPLFEGKEMQVSWRPRSVPELIRQLEREGKAAVVKNHRVPVAIMMPLGILTRLKEERHKVSDWADEVTNWVYLNRVEDCYAIL